jgi:hypothetical protein
VLTISTGSETSIQLPEDLFCAGQAQLANGNVLFAGGTLQYDIATDNCNGKWHGLKAAYEYDIASSSFVKVNSMRHGRWYPSLVTLPDGKVVVLSGFDEFGDYNRLVEIYDSSSKSWVIKYDSSSSRIYCVGSAAKDMCPGAGTPCYGSSASGAAPVTSIYPRSHLLPSGLVVVCGMQKTLWTWDPSNGKWSNIGILGTSRDYGTSILLPLENTASERGKILLVGGSPTAAEPSTSKAEILDFNEGTPSSPVIRTVDSLHYSRKYLLPVILPDGNAVVFAGSSGGSGPGSNTRRYVPEVFDPGTESWADLASATVPRVYHGVALLLPDGRVWTAGSTPTRTSWELRTEFFRPAYYSSSNRPAISAQPTVGSYGGTITIPTANAADIDAVSLLRLSNTTHHYDTDQRLVWLQIQSKTSSSVKTLAPINSKIAPPGYYLIHILKSGLPSRARTIRIR